jgi:hypothetical protein
MSSISFACPACRGPTEVRDSRPRMEEGGIRRRRHCADCGHRFTTWEVQAGDIDALMSGVQNAPPEVYRQVKEMASLLAGLSGDPTSRSATPGRWRPAAASTSIHWLPEEAQLGDDVPRLGARTG